MKKLLSLCSETNTEGATPLIYGCEVQSWKSKNCNNNNNDNKMNRLSSYFVSVRSFKWE